MADEPKNDAERPRRLTTALVMHPLLTSIVRRSGFSPRAAVRDPDARLRPPPASEVVRMFMTIQMAPLMATVTGELAASQSIEAAQRVLRQAVEFRLAVLADEGAAPTNYRAVVEKIVREMLDEGGEPMSIETAFQQVVDRAVEWNLPDAFKSRFAYKLAEVAGVFRGLEPNAEPSEDASTTPAP